MTDPLRLEPITARAVMPNDDIWRAYEDPSVPTEELMKIIKIAYPEEDLDDA